MPKTGIHWFRHGLRLHDNPSLTACCDDIERFIPVFIFDNKTAGFSFENIIELYLIIHY